MYPGVFLAKKKDGSIYYRSSFTYKSKHISLGSFSTEKLAHKAYLEAVQLTSSPKAITIADYNRKKRVLSFEKWVVLLISRTMVCILKTQYIFVPSTLNTT